MPRVKLQLAQGSSKRGFELLRVDCTVKQG